MPARIDIFNEMVGLIFSQLYENFPLHGTVDPKALGEAMGLSVTANATLGDGFFDVANLPTGDPFYPLLFAAASWLRDEGFTRADDSSGVKGVVLTAKALAVLNAIPTNVGGKTLGRKLTAAATSAGTETGRAAIGELVGQVIGGFTKGISN